MERPVGNDDEPSDPRREAAQHGVEEGGPEGASEPARIEARLHEHVEARDGGRERVIRRQHERRAVAAVDHKDGGGFAAAADEFEEPGRRIR